MCPITSPSVQRTTATPHDIGQTRSTPQVRPIPPICRTSSTASSKEDLQLTWLPMGASSPQVHLLITHLVLGCRRRSPLPLARQVSTCRGAPGRSPARLWLRAANPPGGGRRFENPSRGEACSLLMVSTKQHRDTINNGHVCLMPACWHAKIWTGEDECGYGCAQISQGMKRPAHKEECVDRTQVLKEG